MGPAFSFEELAKFGRHRGMGHGRSFMSKLYLHHTYAVSFHNSRVYFS